MPNRNTNDVFLDKFEEYLHWTQQKAETLSQKNWPKNDLTVLDIPLLYNSNAYPVFLAFIRQLGFTKVNVGLTSLLQNKIPLSIYKKLPQFNLSCASAHGTSIKQAIKNNVTYSMILGEDLKLLENIDKNFEIPINYDVFAGHDPNIIFQSDFRITYKNNLKFLKEKLNISSNNKYCVSEYIIREIAAIYKNSKRQIFFEIPGSKGWSLMEDLNQEYLMYISQLIDEYLPTAKITIDLAHVITWHSDTKELARIADSLSFLADKISMLHISSAGSEAARFVELYKHWQFKKMPNWKIHGQDLSLWVFEEKMMVLLQQIRNILPNIKFEVLELRTPSSVLEVYFPDKKVRRFDSMLTNNLDIQAKLFLPNTSSS